MLLVFLGCWVTARAAETAVGGPLGQIDNLENRNNIRVFVGRFVEF